MLEDPDVDPYLLLATSRWFLLCSQEYLKQYAKHGISLESGGGKVNWHCPGCIKRYKASRDCPRRTIHICNPDAKGNQRVLVSAFVGEIPDGRTCRGGRNINASLALLRTSALMTTIGDRTVTVNLLLEAIQTLEVESEARLADYYGDLKVHLKAGDFRNSDKYYNHAAICEDTRLSISTVGQPFVGFLLCANKIPTLTLVHLQLWIDVMCSFAVVDTQALPPSEKQ